jgi:hypothetical protein
MGRLERKRLDPCGRQLQEPRLRPAHGVWPYYLGWNAQVSNVPGSTVLFPVVDCTWQYINALLIIASEPDGKRPIFVVDWRTFHPKGLVERMAKLAGTLGMAEKVPYHPIGGLKWVRNGFVNKDNVAPLGFGGALRTDYEAFFYRYGRFPAHVDAFYTPGMWLQFSHLEMEYYDRYYDKAQYERQAAHDKLWHGR